MVHDQQTGTKYRAAREDKGWSRFDLRTKSGISESTIVRVERGDEGVSLESLVKLAEVLGIDGPAPDLSAIASAEQPPAWFSQFAEQLDERLRDIERSLATLHRLGH